MAEVKRWVQLSPDILLEYLYHDPSNPTKELATDTNDNARIHIINNPYLNGDNQFFNEDNAINQTKNVRTRSAVPIKDDKSQWASLTIQSVLNYLDYDDTLLSVNELEDQLTTGNLNSPVENIIYERVRVHLSSSFEFDDNFNDGFILEAGFKDRQDNFQILSALKYLYFDNYVEFNSDRLLVGQKLYTRYIEFWMPSIKNLYDEWVLNKNDTDLFANQITDNNGIPFNANIEFKLHTLDNVEEKNGQTYLNVESTNTATIPYEDPYANLSAKIEEADDGDYFLLYGAQSGESFENFINRQENEPDTDINVIHEIKVFEQIGTTWVETTDITNIQTQDFNDPFFFRPVIKNAHVAISFRIDYTLRIINTIDNSQIIRNSTLTKHNVKTYGKKLQRIDVDNDLRVNQIINQLPNLESETGILDLISQGQAETVTQIEPIFFDRYHVVSQFSNQQPGTQIQFDSSRQPIYRQGEVNVGIPETGSTLLFRISEIQTTENGELNIQPVDLSEINRLFIHFEGQNINQTLTIENFDSLDIQPENGEVAFIVTAERAQQILALEGDIFYITLTSEALESVNQNEDSTLVYQGRFGNANQSARQIWSDRIERLEIQNADLEQQISQLEQEKEAQRQSLQNRIDELEALNAVLQNQQPPSSTETNKKPQDESNLLQGGKTVKNFTINPK